MKKWMKPSKLEWISFFTIMPLLCVMLNYLLFGARQFQDYRIWLYSFPVIYAQGFVSWWLHIVVMNWLRIRFPDIRQTSKRLFILALAHISMISLTYIILF